MKIATLFMLTNFCEVSFSSTIAELDMGSFEEGG